MVQFQEMLKLFAPEFTHLQKLGFNIVRLLVMWKAIEPRRSKNPEILLPEGKTYLNYVKEIIDILHHHGIFVIIDFHQDIAHEIYDGDGFPDWVLGINKWLAIFNFKRQKNKIWQMNYLFNHFVKSTLGDFWLNKKPMISRTHLEKTIGAAARFFQSLNNGCGHPGILGYELFNEPHPVWIDPEMFEREILPEYYGNTIDEIRQNFEKISGDKDSFIFVEPRVDSTIRSISVDKSKLLNFLLRLESKLDLSKLDHDRLVFSFHYYDPLLFIPLLPNDIKERTREWQKIFREITERAQHKNLIPFLTEFGADQDWKQFASIYPEHRDLARDIMNEQYKYVEENLLNATYWNYDFYNTEKDHDNWNLEDFSILGPRRQPRNDDIIARPYPVRSSAEPKLLTFDLNTKLCVMMFGDLVESSHDTIIYIPYDFHYKNGFEVRATSNNMRFDMENNLLFWGLSNSQKHQIIICPPKSFDVGTLPDDAQNVYKSFDHVIRSF